VSLRKEVSFLRRFRWALLFLVGLVVIGAGASSVLAGAQKTGEMTYWNNAIHATTGGTADAWLGYGQVTTFTFNDVSDLYRAMDGTVFLNFNGLSKSIRTGGGGGYATTVNVKVTGVGTTTFTTTLANPWRPHVAFSAAEGVGWNAYGAVNLPGYVWKGASSLKVTVASVTTNTFLQLGAEGVMIGYTTVGY
jgi:hypothetical protein